MRPREFDIEAVEFRDGIGLSPVVRLNGMTVGVLFCPRENGEPRFSVYEARDQQRPGMEGYQPVAVWRGSRQEFVEFVNARRSAGEMFVQHC